MKIYRVNNLTGKKELIRMNPMDIKQIEENNFARDARASVAKTFRRYAFFNKRSNAAKSKYHMIVIA